MVLFIQYREDSAGRRRRQTLILICRRIYSPFLFRLGDPKLAVSSVNQFFAHVPTAVLENQFSRKLPPLFSLDLGRNYGEDRQVRDK